MDVLQVSHGIHCMLLLITEDPGPVACTVYGMGVFNWADSLSESKEKHLFQGCGRAAVSWWLTVWKSLCCHLSFY